MLPHVPRSPRPNEDIEEKLFRLLVANVKDYAVFMIDKDGYILTWNPGAEHVKGYTEQEIIGKHISIFYTEQNNLANEPQNNLTEALAMGTCEKEGWRVKKDGTLFWANIIYTVLYDENQQITGLAKIVRDISERKKSEHVIREHVAKLEASKLIETSELFNRTVLESSPDCLTVLDQEGRMEYMNLNGLLHMEIDNFSAFKKTKWADLFCTESEVLVTASIKKALSGETVHFTALCPTVKGTAKWWDVIVSPVGKPGGAVLQIISTARDITDQKRSQEINDRIASHLKLATDSANVGVWSLDIKTHELEWSALHKKMWGYDVERTDLEYRDWHEIILPEDKKLAFKKVGEALVNHSFYEVEYRINKADGSGVRYIRSVGRYYYNNKGEAETLTGVSIDITEQKYFTKELEKKVKERTDELAIKTSQLEEINKAHVLDNIQLESANDQLEQFAYIASHDLKEPLRMVKSFVGLLEKKYSSQLDDTAKKYIHFAVDGSKRMETLITDLLAYFTAGRHEISTELTDITNVLEEVKRLYESNIKEKLAVVTFDLMPMVNVSRVAISQVFQNLIGNALKYQTKGVRPIIHISVNDISSHWQFSVKDNGIGISEENHEKVFKIFNRLHNKQEFSGTGIGLSIVKRIVEHNQGKIWIESTKGVGSTFHFTLIK